MASIQFQKPIEQTSTYMQYTEVHHQKTTTETCHKANNENSFTDKVKEMANSATKMLTGHGHQNHPSNVSHESHAKHHHVQQQSACQQGSSTADHLAAAGEKKKQHKQKHIGHGFGAVLPMKLFKNKKDNGEMCDDSSSNSSSSDESDNETCEKKN